MKQLRQITVRNLDPRLQEEIRRLAAAEDISLNKAALRLLRKGADLEEGRPSRPVIGGGLDHLFGTWSEKEAKEFDAALRSCEKVDRDFWA
jgi:hypothetical protein